MAKVEQAKGAKEAKENQDNKDTSKDAVSSDIPKEVECADFYHGLLPREDLPCLLEQVGDYLIRVTQPKPGDPREIVISLRVTDDDEPSAVRHVVIHKRQRKDGKYEWLAIEQNKFDSVKELINAYVSSKKPINPEIKTSILVRSVPRQPWEFLHESITLKEMLGEGQFGEVRAGEVIIGGKKIPVAIKIAKTIKDTKQLELAKEKVKEMMHEARLMRYFEHENVVKIHGVAVCREPLMIIIEMVNGGCLSDVLECRKGKVDEVEKIENMSLGSARGLDYIHSQKVIHRDIAARNVLYTEKRVAKISDFGMSRAGEIYAMARGNKKVPLKWTAPESMVAYQYTPKTDVFSFSILLWEIFSDGEEPYKGMTSIEVKRMISCGERMKKPEGCPDIMFQVMERCWEQNPVKRYTMAQVVRYIEEVLDRLYYDDGDKHETTLTAESQMYSSRERVNSREEMDDSESSVSKRKRKKRKRRRRKRHRRSRHRKSTDYDEERRVVSAVPAIPRRRRRKSTHTQIP